MNLKLKQILGASAALSRLGSEKMPVKIAYAIARNIQKISPELENFEKTRSDLLKNKYGEKNSDGVLEVPPNKRDAFIEDLDELQGLEVDVDIWTINLSEIEMLQKDKFIVTPLELASLDFMFTYDLECSASAGDGQSDVKDA